MKPPSIPYPMAEDRATVEIVAESVIDTEEYEHDVVIHDTNIDILFGCLNIPRSTHVYEDGVTVEILNLSNEDSQVKLEERKYNGSRVFYKKEDGENKVLCYFPGYSIEKYIVATKENSTTITDTMTGIEEVLEPVMRGVPDSNIGSLHMSNDGPLVLVFKVAGRVRLHMMRSAAHGFDEQFINNFSEEYEGAKFEDLFSASENTSQKCHLFRQGSRCSAMRPPQDENDRTFLYMGMLQGETQLGDPSVAPVLSLRTSRLSPEMAVSILRTDELGLICYRHSGGEIQLLSENYLQRVSTMTGVSMDELIEGTDTEDFHIRPRVLQDEEKFSHKLVSSRFPRVLDLLSLYILCGTHSNKKMPTVSGFSTKIDAGGRILATPKRGFYNFCRAAGVNPRRELPFPATPSSMRLAIRRIVLNATLSSNSIHIEKQFDDYENVLFQLVPQLISRILSGSAALSQAFETAFGISVLQLMSNLNNTSRPARREDLQLKSIRSALLLSDHYRLVTIARFALRHLSEAEFTPSVMREAQLMSMLCEYSNSSRRRRMVAESVNTAHLSDFAPWPLPSEGAN